jgi:hypothetical protein
MKSLPPNQPDARSPSSQAAISFRKGKRQTQSGNKIQQSGKTREKVDVISGTGAAEFAARDKDIDLKPKDCRL